jgi:hypothetical protein
VIYNFRTTDDGQQWMIDTESQPAYWAKASSILAAPSVSAAANNSASFVPQEEGTLVPLGGGRYALKGRKPIGPDGKPQLSIIIILTVLSSEEGGTCVTFVQTNVDIKDLQHAEIKNFKTEALPAVKTPTRPAPQAMPPITKEEQAAAIPSMPDVIKEALEPAADGGR